MKNPFKALTEALSSPVVPECGDEITYQDSSLEPSLQTRKVVGRGNTDGNFSLVKDSRVPDGKIAVWDTEVKTLHRKRGR